MEDSEVSIEESIPLISAIVPIYNVESYLRRCLDSLKNQTMKQIEVICIDDGSTDESGRIAEEYVSDDWPQFRVIRTENRGVSAARNLGLDEAKADWIMFVDSDDWVDKRFCEIPYIAAIKNHADMVIFGVHTVSEKGKVRKEKRKSISVGMISFEIAIDIGGTAAWNKLYKKELFDKIRYPKGHEYEDYAITHRLVYRAQRIVHVAEKMYYYRYRKGSICHSIAGDEDRLEMSKRRCQELIDLGYPEEKAKAQLIGDALRCCGRMKCYSSSYKEAVEIIDSNRKTIEMLTGKERQMLRVWRVDKSLYRIIYKGYMKLLRSTV